MRNDPIGLMDSGVGGLTVLKAIHRRLPAEATVYFGDQQRLPYGPRTKQEVRTFVRQIATFLRRTDRIKLLVIACNTATAAALPALYQELPIPVVGVIAPGAKAAAKVTQTHRIGVIATAGTVNSRSYDRLVRKQDLQNQVTSLACPEFVTLAEANDLTSPHAQQVVTAKLQPLRAAHLDTLILGCTHFPLLQPVIHRAMGPTVHLVDPGVATAQRVATVLTEHQLTRLKTTPPTARYYTTGDGASFERVAQQWLSTAVHVQTVPLTDLTQLDTLEAK